MVTDNRRAGSGSSVRDLHGREQVAGALLLPVPPFDFHRSARIAAAGDARFRRYEAGRYTHAIRLGHRPALVVLHADGTVDQPHLYMELRSPDHLGTAELARAREAVSRIFRLDLSLAPFNATVLADPVMSALAHRLHGLHPPGSAGALEEAVEALLDHRLWTAPAGGAGTAGLVAALGERLELVGRLYMAFPPAATLALAPEALLRTLGLTRGHARAVRGLARAVAEGLVDLDGCTSVRDCAAAVRAVPGLGGWTAELEALAGARRLDSLPEPDLALRRAVSHYYFGDRPCSRAEVEQVAERWGRYAGLAAHYLVTAWREGIEAAGSPDTP